MPLMRMSPRNRLPIPLCLEVDIIQNWAVLPSDGDYGWLIMAPPVENALCDWSLKQLTCLRESGTMRCPLCLRRQLSFSFDAPQHLQFVTINTARCKDVKINCRNRQSWTKRSFLFSFFIQYWMTFLNVGLEPASARKTSEPAVKTTPPNIAPTLLTRTLWEGFRY